MEEGNKSAEETSDKKAESGSISLGGNIELIGFNALEPAKAVVLRKMIGTFTREIQDKKSDYEKLAVTLEEGEGNAKIKVELTAGGNTITGEDTQNNVFMALGNAVKKVMDQI